jgi:PAS domain S-box-containing protein
LSQSSNQGQESERLRILREYPLDGSGSDRLDRIARLAAQICRAPIALVSLVEEDRQVFVGKFGLQVTATPREQSFCAYCMMGSEAMEVPDATRDKRFGMNPLVTGEPGLRFYGGHPLISPEGKPLGALCVMDVEAREGLTPGQKEGLATLAELVIDILEGLRADARSRADKTRSLSRFAELEQRFAVLADSLPQMVWSTTPDGQPDYFNLPWCDFTGVPAHASYGNGWLEFLHPEDAPVAAQVWSEAVSTGQTYEVRYRMRHWTGEYRWVIARGLPMQDDGGNVVRWIGTCTDIQDEMATADALELLSQELSHRIKNIFAVIGGLVSLSSRNHPDATDFARELYGRILALGRAHGFVGSRGANNHLSASGGLKGMLAELLLPYQTSGCGRISVAGDNIAIDDRSATPLALVFHELATNSSKYGAIGSDEGTVEIILTDGDPVRMIWIERGTVRPPGDANAGFGSRLIEMSIKRQLGGEIARNWEGDHLHIELTIPQANVSRG